MGIKVADEVWVATALLHREHPERQDFSVGEIVERAWKENLAGQYRPGVQIHVSSHCVADKAPNPARYRMLHETRRGRRRLFRDGDPFHAHRAEGRVRPNREDLPPRYRYLVDWYEAVFRRGSDNRPGPPGGTPGPELLKFCGVIESADLQRMNEAIRDCERVDRSEW